eukprot:766587-Hanusia_phi.AAC.3
MQANGSVGIRSEDREDYTHQEGPVCISCSHERGGKQGARNCSMSLNNKSLLRFFELEMTRSCYASGEQVLDTRTS